MWNCLWQSGWSPTLHFSQKYRVVFWHEAHLRCFPLPIQWLIASNRTSSLTFDNFLAGRRYLLLLIFEDIYNMYQQLFSEIPVYSTCVLPQSASVDGTADMHCLLIDPNKNGKLATTISCYDDLSCKSWCFDRGDQLLPYLYYREKWLVNLSPAILGFDITMSFPEGHFSNICRHYCYHFIALPSNKR